MSESPTQRPGDDDANNLTYGTRSISLTVPLPSRIHTNSELDGDNTSSPATFHTVGTFLVRDDIPNGPMLPKTPGRGRGALIKDFFSPLPLERMFEPPTPPIAPMPQPAAEPPDSPSDEILGNRYAEHDEAKPSYPQAQSTPTPPYAPNSAAPTAPMTDPRLRLFQFQYDTFTREHLSALADSIAVNTPSGTGSDRRLSRVSEASYSHLRSTKRARARGRLLARPKIYGKAYVGESRSLMEANQAGARFFHHLDRGERAELEPGDSDDRDAPNDKLSAYEQLRRSSLLSIPTNSDSNPSSTGTMNSNSTAPYSSSTYRQQAAALMAQIKSDMKGNKRIFSGDSEMSHVTAELSFTHVAQPPTIVLHMHDKENHQRETPRQHRPQHIVHQLHAHAHEPAARAARAGADGRGGRGARGRDGQALRGDGGGPARPQWCTPRRRAPRCSGLRAPPVSVRAGTNVEDLNRFVSSSTASGTTLTAGSIPAYVKHAGAAQIRTIAPQDVVGALPERLGDMMFDKVMMRWVKTVEEEGGVGEASEDPFGDIESLRDDTRSGREGGETEDEEEMELTSFSTDASGRVVAVMTGVDTDGMEDTTTDSEGGNDAVVTGEPMPESDRGSLGSDGDDDETQTSAAFSDHQQSLTDAFAPPPIVVTTFNTPPPSAPRSALKSAVAPKNHVGATPTPYRTPRRTHRRSVSFSDGKRDGPIRGLVNGSMVQPSARSKRIAEMLARGDSSASDADDTESPIRSGGPASASASGSTSVASASASVSTSTSRRVFSRAHASTSRGALNNNTFLTECSFGVAHDRLVAALTDIEPFTPHWDALAHVDLSHKGLESAARLKELVPALDGLSLNDNALAWLSGVPPGVRTLSAAGNRLTGLTAYGHLLNLESLDISRNEVDSLRQLAPLRHLRELRADGNAVGSVEGLERMDGLVKLSLENCAFAGAVDLGGVRWTRLEMLNLSGNRIERLEGLEGLGALVALNVDNNALITLAPARAMPRLRILRLSHNRLRTLVVGGADSPAAAARGMDDAAGGTDASSREDGEGDAEAGGVRGLERLLRLENLSLRNQRGGRRRDRDRKGKEAGVFSPPDVRDVKRLYLSGNALPRRFLSAACYHLVYLELAGCRLTGLPGGLAQLTPNLRILNLNYNFLEELGSALAGLGRLRKLSVVGSRIRGTKELIRVVQSLPEVEVLDFRMNPCTLGWYLPLLVNGMVEGNKDGRSWAELDGRFRRGLPDGVYVGRLAYRGLVMRACAGLRVLDGVGVTEKERAKTQGVLAGLGLDDDL
ncbi:hypothetical protein C8J57DRAFT_1724822 [Mycena rebaudengoi]|nr:hypothetical protein C8J57DRAFT_1724822 [Mycena rebaudengoi]